MANSNFAVLNPLVKGSRSSLADGNLTHASGTADLSGVNATMGITSGKWYWEVFITDGGSGFFYIGINSGYEGGGEYYQGYSYLNGVIQGPCRYRDNGTITDVSSSDDPDRWGTVSISTTGVSTMDNGDVMMVALDYDNKKIWYGKNGTFYNSGNPATGTNAQATWDGTKISDGTHPIFPNFTGYVTGNKQTVNFGQDSSFAGRKSTGSTAAADGNGFGDFYYTPPSGYLALCSGNQVTSTDIDPAKTDDNIPIKNVGVVKYTGTGTSQSITGLGFQPDLVWIKQRNGSGHNVLTDSTRGVTKQLEITDTEGGSQPAESTNTDGVTAFGTDGFTVGGDAAYSGNTNTYVAWCWRANGGTTSTNTDGTVASTVQANQAAGFSIVSYTGTGTSMTIGHGLSKAPNFTIVKDRSNDGSNWIAFYDVDDGTLDYMYPNAYSGKSDSSLTGPNDTIWNFDGSNNMYNTSSRNYIMYAWHNVDGYQRFGTYNGNNRDDGGPFVFTGFRPKIVVIKGIEEQYGWHVFDTERSTGNLMSDNITWFPGGAETSEPTGARKIDFLGNGFKVMADAASLNGQDDRYLYMAWADVPFKYNNTF